MEREQGGQVHEVVLLDPANGCLWETGAGRKLNSRRDKIELGKAAREGRKVFSGKPQR